MEKDDIESLERITAKYKIRYDNLEVSYKDEILGTRMYFLANITQLVRDMYEFEDTLIDTTNFELHCAISIMNLFGHYKNFYMTRGEVVKTIIIGYVKDGWTYKKYSKLLDMVCDICNYFKGTYFIPDIYDGNHIHLICAAIIHMDSFVIDKRIPRTIHVYSAYNMDKQILNCIPTKTAHKFSKEISGKITDISKENMMKDLFKKKDYYDQSKYKSEIDALLIPIGKFLNTLVCSPSKIEHQDKVQYTIRMMKDKLDLLTKFLSEVYNPGNLDGISAQFFKFLNESGVFVAEIDSNTFYKYLKKTDFRFKNVGLLNSTLAPLIDSWKKKIKDYAMAKDSEKFQLLVKHQLYVNWLQ